MFFGKYHDFLMMISIWLVMIYFRERPAPKVWWVSPRACQYSHLWHWSLLPGQKDVYCHFQGRDDIPVFRAEGLIASLSVPSHTKDRHTCPHPSTLLFCHHLYHSHQLLRHDQARHRVSPLKFFFQDLIRLRRKISFWWWRSVERRTPK